MNETIPLSLLNRGNVSFESSSDARRAASRSAGYLCGYRLVREGS